MRPTVEQQKSITTLLRSHLKYKETYDEVYDHILSWFEKLPVDVSFAFALRNIVENDLGGAKGMKALERKLLIFSIREFIREYFVHFIEAFNSILVVPIAVCAALFYHAIDSGWLNQRGATAIISYMTLDICIVIMLLVNYKKWRSRRNFTQGIIPLRRTILKFSSTLLFVPFYLWAKTHEFYAAKDIPVKILTALFLITVIHITACFKLLMNKKNFQYAT